MGCCSSADISHAISRVSQFSAEEESRGKYSDVADDPMSMRITETFKDVESLSEEKFDWGEEIGRGAFGFVISCTQIESGREMCCKILDTKVFTEEVISLTMQEIDTMIRLNGQHRNLLEFYGVKRLGSQLQVFMEICYGGNLNQELDTRIKTTGDCKEIARQLYDVLKFLHNKKIIHMDLKLENIMLKGVTGTEIRLIDLGMCARRNTGVTASGGRGTFANMAPEVILGNDFTEQADIWSAAICIYKLVSGEQFGPFHLFRKAKMTKEYVQQAFDVEKIEWPPCASPECQDVLRASFAFFPSRRPTAHELLLYPWFTSSEQSANLIDDDAMARLRMFAHRGKLQHALTPLMLEQAKRMYKDDRIIEIAKRVHGKTGKPSSKGFNFEDFVAMVKELVTSENSDSDDDFMADLNELQAVFDAIDTDGTGTIDLAEFMNWFWYDYIMKQDERLFAFIQTLDVHNHGYITLEDIEQKIKGFHPDWKEYMEAFQKVMKPGEEYSIEHFAQLFHGDAETQQPRSLESHVWGRIQNPAMMRRSSNLLIQSWEIS